MKKDYITEIRLNGIVNYDYFAIDESIIDKDILDNQESNLYKQNFYPQWNSDIFSNPLLVCNYNNTIDSESKNNILNDIIKLIIYRVQYEIINGKKEIIEYKKIAEIDNKNSNPINIIKDYTYTNNKLYEWIVYPIMKETNGNVKNLGAQYLNKNNLKFLNSNNDLYVYFIQKDENNDNIYIPKDIFHFQCNINIQSLNQNINKVQIENYTQYPKFSVGEKNYISGSVSCLLGNIMYRENETEILNEFNIENNIQYINYNEPYTLWKKWLEDINSGLKIFIKDSKGNSFVAQIDNNSASYLKTNNDNPPTNINFNFTECLSKDNIQIFSFENKFNIEE